MDANAINELKNGLSAAYINSSLAANLVYKPAFISNNREEGKKVISSVEDSCAVKNFRSVLHFAAPLGRDYPLARTLKSLRKRALRDRSLRLITWILVNRNS